MGTYAGKRAEWWFGKRTKLAPGTEAGTDAQGRYGKVSQTRRWFSYDWWMGHYHSREWDGTFGGDYKPAARPRGFKSAAERTAAARREYAAYCQHEFLAAEAATNGHMVTKAGQARGIDGESFFDPNAARRPSMKWASDELRGWFGHSSAAGGGRRGARRLLSFTAWQEQTREKAAA